MEITVESKRELIGLLIDIMSLGVSQEYILQIPERRFLIENVILKWEGYDLSSPRCVNELKRRFGWKDKSRHVYKNRSMLASKGWLMRDSDGYILPPELVNPLPSQLILDFKINLVEKKDENVDRQDSSGGGEVLQ